MSFDSMKRIRLSSLTDATLVDVLEALAVFENADTGECYPSTESLARVSRRNVHLVRKTLQKLEDMGLVSSTQEPGKKRSFLLHLEQLEESEPLKDSYPRKEPYPLKDSYPRKEPDGDPVRNLTGTPLESLRGPRKEPYPEKRREKRNEKIKEQVGTFQDPPPPADPAASELFPEPEPQPKARKRAALESFPQDLPEEWRKSAKEARPDIDPAYVFGKLKARYAGTVTKKALATWRREYMNWIGREFARPQNNSNKPSSWIRKDQSTMDYSEDSVRKFLGCA